jgi:predicted phage terminase large subunit-like protein
VISTLKKKITGIIAVEPQGGKIARVVAASPTVEGGNVFLPSMTHAPWVEGFKAECAGFPNVANDDQVDAFSQAMLRLADGAEPAGARSPYSGAPGGEGGRDANGRRRRAA